MEILISILSVLFVALLLGAGIPIMFAIGVHFEAAAKYPSKGSSSSTGSFGVIIGYLLYALCLVAIIVGLLWLTNDTIAHYTGFDIFGTAGSGGGH